MSDGCFFGPAPTASQVRFLAFFQAELYVDFPADSVDGMLVVDDFEYEVCFDHMVGCGYY